MQIDRPALEAAVAKNILSAAQAEALWSHLDGAQGSSPRFTGLNVAYYFGALVVIAAMGWLMTLGFQSLGPWAVFFIALAYALVFLRAGAKLYAELPIPSGLLFTMAVCMTPLAIWGLERGSGFWPDNDPGNYRDFFPYVRSSWIWMEMGTVLASLFALRRMRFAFLVAPAAVALWFMSMDFATYLSGSAGYAFELGQKVSINFGIGMLAVAYFIDRRTKEDLAFWLYLFGMTALWCGISATHSHSEWNKVLYFALNLFFIAVSALIGRRIFLIYGAIGANAALCMLAYDVFEDSVMFPFVLTAIGLGVIAIAVKYQRHRAAADAWVIAVVPQGLRSLLPASRVR